MAFACARRGRAEVRGARLFNPYGPQMHPDDGRVVSILVCQALSGSDITIYGDGSQTRSFCYISDMVEGLIRLVERDDMPHSPVNLGNPDDYTISELLEQVIAPTGRNAPVNPTPLTADDD